MERPDVYERLRMMLARRCRLGASFAQAGLRSFPNEAPGEALVLS
jgi:hypothetical protein